MLCSCPAKTKSVRHFDDVINFDHKATFPRLDEHGQQDKTERRRGGNKIGKGSKVFLGLLDINV